MGLTDQDLVEELCDIESGLNDWELQFVVAMSKRVLDEKQDMTPNMRIKAKQILEERGLEC